MAIPKKVLFALTLCVSSIFLAGCTKTRYEGLSAEEWAGEYYAIESDYESIEEELAILTDEHELLEKDSCDLAERFKLSVESLAESYNIELTYDMKKTVREIEDRFCSH